MASATTDRRDRFERIFARHHGDLERYARRRAVSRDLADDVVAETFLVVWRRLDEVPEDALPWLYATARGVLANQHRSARRGARLAERLAAQWSEALPASADAEGDGALLQALARLGEADREALLLVAWEGLSRPDAAAALGVSRAALAARLLRARGRLRRELEHVASERADATGAPRGPLEDPDDRPHRPRRRPHGAPRAPQPRPRPGGAGAPGRRGPRAPRPRAPRAAAARAAAPPPPAVAALPRGRLRPAGARRRRARGRGLERRRHLAARARGPGVQRLDRGGGGRALHPRAPADLRRAAAASGDRLPGRDDLLGGRRPALGRPPRRRADPRGRPDRRSPARRQGGPGGRGRDGGARSGRPRRLRPPHGPGDRGVQRPAARLGAPSLDPCQVILPGRASPPCGDASSVVLQEDAGGSWRAAPAGRTVPTAIVGTTSLAVLERPGTAEDRLSADVLGPTPEETRRELLGRHAPPGPPPAWDLAAGRLALERDGFRYYVVPAPHDVICLVVRSADGGSGGMTCDRRLTLVTAGAISAGFDADGRFIVAGVVGDGYDTAALPDGAATPIAGNVFAIEIPEGVDAVTLSGPAGRHLVPVVGRGG